MSGRPDGNIPKSPFLVLAAGNFGSLGLGAIAGLLLARLLGPVGRGDWAIVCFWPVLIASVALSGVDSLAVRSWSSGTSSRAAAVRGIKTLSRLLPIWVLICIFAVFANVSRRFDHLAPQAYLLTFLVVPYAVGMYATNLLLYWRGALTYSIVRIFQPAAYVVAIATMAVFELIRLDLLVVVLLFLYGLWSMVAAKALAGSVRTEDGSADDQDGFSWIEVLKQGLATLPVHLSNNMPMLFLALKSTSVQAGYFVVANSVTQLLMPLAYAIAKGAAVRVTQLAPQARANWIRRRYFSAAGLLLLVAWAVAVGAAYVIVGFFGDSYSPAVPVLQTLVFAAALQGCSIVIEEAIRVVGRPSRYIYVRFAVAAAAISAVIFATRSLNASEVALIVLCAAAVEAAIIAVLIWRGDMTPVLHRCTGNEP